MQLFNEHTEVPVTKDSENEGHLDGQSLGRPD